MICKYWLSLPRHSGAGEEKKEIPTKNISMTERGKHDCCVGEEREVEGKGTGKGKGKERNTGVVCSCCGMADNMKKFSSADVCLC